MSANQYHVTEVASARAAAEQAHKIGLHGLYPRALMTLDAELTRLLAHSNSPDRSTHLARMILSLAEAANKCEGLDAFQRGIYIGQLDLLRLHFGADGDVCAEARDAIFLMR